MILLPKPLTEEVIVQPRFLIGILVLQAERLVYAFFQTGMIGVGQFAPTAVFAAPNDVAFCVG